MSKLYRYLSLIMAFVLFMIPNVSLASNLTEESLNENINNFEMESVESQEYKEEYQEDDYEFESEKNNETIFETLEETKVESFENEDETQKETSEEAISNEDKTQMETSEETISDEDESIEEEIETVELQKRMEEPEVGEPVKGFLKYVMNLRNSPNGEIIGSLDKNSLITGTKYSNGWIQLADGNYLYDFGLLETIQVKGFIKNDMNVRTTPNGKIVRVESKGSLVSGTKGSDSWIKLNDGNYLYDFGLLDSLQVKGFIKLDTNVRISPNGKIVSVATKGSLVSGTKNTNGWIRLDNGNHLYDFGLAEKIQIKGYLKGDMNVRTSPNGKIVGVYKANTAVNGIKETNGWIKLKNGNYIYDFGLLNSNISLTPVIRLNAGHGKGDDYNRGGIKFNEGDENYEFTGLLLNRLNKYEVDAKELRHSLGNIEDEREFDELRDWGTNADLYYSAHSNAFNGKVSGVEVFLSYKSLEYYDFAKDLASTISNTLGIPNRGVRFINRNTGYFEYIDTADSSKNDWLNELYLNKAKCAVLVEHFYHDNINDSNKYLKNKEKLADELVKVIAKHFNLALK